MFKFDNNDNYYRKMSNHEFYPILDCVDDVEERGYRDYKELIKTVKEVFKGVRWDTLLQVGLVLLEVI